MSNSKMLEMHPDKTVFVTFGTKNQIKSLDDLSKKEPIYFNDFVTKKKVSEKWLGDMLHEGGLSLSVEETVKARYGMTVAAIYEVAAIVQDFRMQSIGGLQTAIDLWELSIIPSLLNNSETWMEIADKAIQLLEELQNMFVRAILRVPISTPKPALKWETGLAPMEHRIMIRKLTFLNDLKHHDDSVLAKQLLKEQIRLGLPGLAKECSDICLRLKLENITKNVVPVKEWKRKVKLASKMQSEVEIKNDMERLSK